MSKAVIFFAPGLEECEGLLCVISCAAPVWK